MDNKKLNSLVVSYQTSPTDENFRKIYEVVTNRWVSENAIFLLSKRYNIDYDDILEMSLDKMYRTSRKYIEGEYDYYNYLAYSISKGCIDIHRAMKKHEVNVSLDYESENEEDCAIVEYLVCANAEDEAIELIQKKYDQRQLIASLTQKVPDKYRQALETFASCDFSYSDAAKRLNISYPAVKRRVEKIASYFSEEEHGYLHDYLTA